MKYPTIAPAKVPKKRVPLLYSFIAPTHDILALIVESNARDRAIELAAIQNGEHILEVAVGTGLSFQYALMQNPTGHNTGIDLTPAMLKKATQRTSRIVKKHRLPGNNVTLALGDAYQIDYPDNQFDLLLNSYMFDLLPVADFTPVLKEFKRVLKPGGRIIQINMTHGLKWYNHFWQGLYRLHPALLGGCRSVSVAPYFSEAGFENVHREYISQWTFPSEVIQGFHPI